VRNDPDQPTIRPIPSNDGAFVALVERITAEESFSSPGALTRRLRRLFPRALVRDRALSGEGPVWYVYRDGGWRPDANGPWWSRPGLPMMILDEGRIVEANQLALGLIGLREADLPIDSMDLVAPESLADARALFEIVRSGRELNATVLLRPLAGEPIAVDLRAAGQDGRVVAVFRLASDVEVDAASERAAGADMAPGVPRVRPPAIATHPADDAVFGRYAEELVRTLHEATPERLELALRRLYPRTRVRRGSEDETWQVFREGEADPAREADGWWDDERLPRVRYDVRGLILDANAPAVAFLGRTLVGHHWQEFVTPNASDDVAPVLDIIRRAGVAISRFRMPTADGTLVEFDSYTTADASADGDSLITVMRPV
jgi:PAS domain-containing protein